MSDVAARVASAGREAQREPRRPLFDPESIPHDPAFADAGVRGTAVSSERLTPEALRLRFAQPPQWQPEIRTDGRLFNLDAEPRSAAVLIPIVQRDDGPRILLTQRTAHLTDHAGQISFPGGRVEGDDADPVAAALRESFEEIGLVPASVDVIGTLPEYVTATSYRVTPVVGLVEQMPELRLDAFEVDEAFEVPFGFLMDPANHERRLIEFGGAPRTFYAMPFTSVRRYFIWGATAAILRNLYHFLRA